MSQDYNSNQSHQGSHSKTAEDRDSSTDKNKDNGVSDTSIENTEDVFEENMKLFQNITIDEKNNNKESQTELPNTSESQCNNISDVRNDTTSGLSYFFAMDLMSLRSNIAAIDERKFMNYKKNSNQFSNKHPNNRPNEKRKNGLSKNHSFGNSNNGQSKYHYNENNNNQSVANGADKVWMDYVNLYSSFIKRKNNFIRPIDTEKQVIKPVIQGSNIIKEVESFEEVNLSEMVMSKLKNLKFFKPTAIQKATIPAILRGRNMMVSSPANSGKIVSYLIPIINQLWTKKTSIIKIEGMCQPQVVILCETKDIVIKIRNITRVFCEESDIRVASIYGEAIKSSQYINLISASPILVATPACLQYLMEMKLIMFFHLEFLVLNQSNKLLDPNTLPIIQNIIQHYTFNLNGNCQILLYAKNLPLDLQVIGSQFLCDYLFITCDINGEPCSQIEQVFYTGHISQKLPSLSVVLKDYLNSSVIIFTLTMETVNEITEFLTDEDIVVKSLHNALPHIEKLKIILDFNNGLFNVLVTTTAAACNLQFKKIDVILNYDIPTDFSEYIRRIEKIENSDQLNKVVINFFGFYD